MLAYIEKLDDFGRGITFIDDKITFVYNSLIGEEVDIKIIKETKKYNVAISCNIVNKSIDRIFPRCPYFLKCGGCNLEHMNIQIENDYKCSKVKNILNKFADISIEKVDIISCNEYNYRNKIVLSVSKNKLGLLEEKTNNIVSIDKCLLVNEKINTIINRLENIINFNDSVKKIMIRTGNRTNEVMIDVLGNIYDIDSLKGISDSLIINNQVITKNYITSYIGNNKFHIRNNSFFQVNDLVVEELYNYIRELVQKRCSKKVLDLYSGVGTIGISVSDLVDEVLGIEVEKSATIDALENKKLNNISNISFINGRVEDELKNYNNEFDTIIVDPPRSGLFKTVREVLFFEKYKNIIYVSCNPTTLARDLKELKDIYNLESIKIFNMFPRTYHVECVVLLCLRDK